MSPDTRPPLLGPDPGIQKVLDHIYYPLGGIAITIGIDGAGHFIILIFIS